MGKFLDKDKGRMVPTHRWRVWFEFSLFLSMIADLYVAMSVGLSDGHQRVVHLKRSPPYFGIGCIEI